MKKFTELRKDNRNIFEAPEIYSQRSKVEITNKYRPDFLRDRDRILYSLEFRRLNGKTQVVLPVANDHIRNRLTHTLEVSQISNVIAKYLRLNESLTEAIALGHDIGHTPFGHVGERTLNFIMNNCEDYFENPKILSNEEKGFKHNLQSVRVCCDLESIYPKTKGLNLTNFTLWGISNHSKSSWEGCREFFKEGKCYYKLKPRICINDGTLEVGFYNQYNKYLYLKDSDKLAWSFEAFVVSLADEIAQRHHDMEDAFHAKILDCKNIIEEIKILFEPIFDEEDRKNFNQLNKERNYFFSNASRFLINLYVKNLIENSIVNFNKFCTNYNLNNRIDFIKEYKNINKDDINNLISFSPELNERDNKFKDFIFKAIHNSFPVQRMDGKGSFIIDQLFKAFITNPRQLRDPTIIYAFNLYKKTNNYPLDFNKKQMGEYRNEIGKYLISNDIEFHKALLRAICDHIAGMTDNFAFAEFSRLYGVTNY